MDRQAELELDSAQALLRAAIRADPGFFPAHFAHIQFLRESGEIDRLRREYAVPPDGTPLSACLSAVGQAPFGYPRQAAGALSALAARYGPTPCTQAFLALWTVSDLDPRPWPPLLRRVPEIGELWIEYALRLRAAGRAGESARALREGLRHAPHPVQRLRLYLWLVHDAEVSGDTARALALRRALRIAVARDGRPGIRALYLSYLVWLPPVADPGPSPEAAQRELAALTRAHRAWQWEWQATFGVAGGWVDGEGNPAAALPLYDRAVEIADSLGHPLLQLQAYLKRGRTRAKAGRLAAAERDLLHAVELGRRAGDRSQWAEAYHNLAHVYEGAGRLGQASRAADRFVELTRPLRWAPIRMMSLHDAGMIRWKAGWHTAANVAFAEMVRVVDEQRSNSYWAGEHFERSGDLQRALVYYRRSRGEADGEITLALAGLARVFEALGMPDSAETAARAHDAMLGSLFDVPVLPGILVRSGRPDEALRISRGWAEKRLAQGNVQGAAMTLLQLSELLLQAGRPGPALAEALRAERLAARLNLTDERIRARCLAGTARVRRGETEAGLALLEDAAAEARAHPTTDAVLSTELALADALAGSGRGAEALAAYGRAARAVERVTGNLAGDLDRTRYRERHLAPFDGALRLLLRGGGGAERLGALAAWSQRRKAAALALSARTAGASRLPAPLPLRSLQSRLRPDEALLDYVVSDTTVAVLVVTRRSAQLVRLPASAAAIRGWAEALRRPLVASYAGRIDLARAPFDLRLAHALYQALLRPVEPLVAGSGRLVVSPDGPLHYVPFEALVTEPPPAAGSGAYAAARYVIDRHLVVYLPSAQFLPRARRGGVRAAVAGAPVLAVARGAPGGGREIDAILAAWPRGRVRVLREDAATETAVNGMGRGYAVLHFATHAEADDRDPLASYLRLAPDRRGDGFLHVAEAAEAPWRARLVVLSACATLSGPLYEGEGLMGLARAFLAGGSGAVVATRWPVGPSSADLMAVFYRELAAGREPAAALHAARLALRRNPRTAHPFHWASFVIVAAG